MGSSLRSWLITVWGEMGRLLQGFGSGPGMGIGSGEGMCEEGT